MSDYRCLTTYRLRSQHRTHSTVGPDNTSAAAVSKSLSRTSYHFRGSSRWTCLPQNLTRTGRSPCLRPEVGGALSFLPHLLLPGKTLLPLPNPLLYPYTGGASYRTQVGTLSSPEARPLAHESSPHPQAGVAKVVLCHVV